MPRLQYNLRESGFKAPVNNTKGLKIFAFSNNHYAGHGPATAKLFVDLWNKEYAEVRCKIKPG